MENREKIVGAVFLVMFGFGLVSLGFQLVLDRVTQQPASAVTYGVFGSMVATGATGYAGLFYFLFRSQQGLAAEPVVEDSDTRVEGPSE